MDKENYWIKFCNTTRQLMAKVSDDFRAEDLPFVDKSSNVDVKLKSDDVTLGKIKDEALTLVEDTQKNELSLKIDNLLEYISERDKKIVQLQADTNDNKKRLADWYKKAKQNSVNLCDELGKYTNDEFGVLNIVAYILEDVVSKEGLEMNKAIAKVKDIISSRKWSRFWNVFGYMFLIVILLAIQVFLSKLIGTNMISKDVEINPLGRWIVCGFIIAFLTVEVFLVVRLFLQLRKKTTEIQQLQLLLYKMEIHKMTEEEIDRALESVQEAASMSNRY